MVRSGCQVVVEALVAAGVEHVFGYPGGAIMPLYDALRDSPITHVLTRHEQAAIHAADAGARASGRLGVCIATSGPGATNLVTGICTAQMDSVPLLCLTGQVATPLVGTDAFQEADTFGIATGITKQAYLVRHVDELPDVLAEAMYLATTGRPGPVLVDIPKDVQLARTSRRSNGPGRLAGYEPTPRLDVGALRRAHARLAAARRPVAIAGGGCKLAGATALLRTWCQRTQMPLVATLNGLGSADPEYPGWLGMMGMHGLRRANRAVAEADLIIGLGNRFDDRATGRLAAFAQHAGVIHIDIDAAEIGKLVPADVAVHADLRQALTAWLELLSSDPVTPCHEWQRQCRAVGDGLQRPATTGDEPISAIELLDALFALIGSDAIVTTDVGQHQMWAAQRVAPADPRRFITSGGAGTMGFGLPAAIGAQMACPDCRVVAIVGDGGFQMSLAELATIRRCGLPVKIVVIDNKYLGMVRQWQELFFDQRYHGVDMSDNPDFAALARVYGLGAWTVRRATELGATLIDWWTSPGPALLHCECRAEENVFPMVPANAALAEMVEANS